MTATGHALVGTLIAAKISNPALAVPLALLSHFAADILPHWDVGTQRRKKTRERLIFEVIGDVLLGFALSFFLLAFLPATNIAYAFLIIIVAQLPDWLMAPYYFFRIRFPLFVWSYRFQKNFNHDLAFPWGVISQIVAVVILYILLFKVF